MNTQRIPNGQSRVPVSRPLDRDEVMITMDIFFDTMEARGVNDPIALYNEAKVFALKTFGKVEGLSTLLVEHSKIRELLLIPEVQKLNQAVKVAALKSTVQKGVASATTTKVNTSTPPPSNNGISQKQQPSRIIPSSSKATSGNAEPQSKIANNDRNLSESQTSRETPLPRSGGYPYLGDTTFVAVPVDTSNPPPMSIEEAFRIGDMGIISKLLTSISGGHSVEEVEVGGGWGNMTTLPPPQDILIGRIVSKEDLQKLMESYKAVNFTQVSEIRELKNGDVVDFKKLDRTNDGKYIRHFRIVKIEEVRMASNDYEILCIANCVFIKNEIAYEVVDAQLRVRMPGTGLKLGSLLRVYNDSGEFFQARISGGMSVFTQDVSAFKKGFFSNQRFVQ